jgi:hypothetical protein
MIFWHRNRNFGTAARRDILGQKEKFWNCKKK